MSVGAWVGIGIAAFVFLMLLVLVRPDQAEHGKLDANVFAKVTPGI